MNTGDVVPQSMSGNESEVGTKLARSAYEEGVPASASRSEVAVVTGGARGVGFGIAEEVIAARGTAVVDLEQSDLDASSRSTRRSSSGLVADVTKLDAVEATYDDMVVHHGHLDAGVAESFPEGDLDIPPRLSRQNLSARVTLRKSGDSSAVIRRSEPSPSDAVSQRVKGLLGQSQKRTIIGTCARE